MPSRLLKKLPRPGGSDPGGAPPWHTHRAVVAGRGAGRPEERHHPPLGQARDTAVGAQGPAHHVGVHLWRHLSGRGQGRGARSAPLQHRRDDAAPRRDRRRRRAGRACCAAARSGRLASLGGSRRPRPTSPCCRCRPNVPSATPSRTSGSSGATTGCRTVSSNPTTTSSTIAASPGTALPISHGASCPSDCATGHIGHDQ